MLKFLIVDDEKNIREVVKEYAKAYDLVCEEAADGLEAVEMVQNKFYNVIVMDIMMPKMDGFSAVSKIREFSNVPIILLSARQEEFDKLHGFDLGIDDYVTKPFSPKELMARIKVIGERSKGIKHSVYQFEGLDVDVSGRTVEVEGERVNLTPKEFDLLVYLIKNEGQALSRETLLEEVWNYNYYGDYRTVDTHIKMLRQNLKSYRKFIVTVRGIGYKFEA